MKNIFSITLFLWFFVPDFLSAKIWINELMQSNIDLVRDDLQEFPDSWIELYNDSDQPVNIMNWTISDNADYRKGWKITKSVVIAPKSFLLIYADRVATGLHTNFRLDSGNGSAVYLFDANGQQMDAVINIPKQPAPNISRGRITDGNDSWAYFVTATPGSSNIEKYSNTLLPPPVFSQKGGIFRNNVSVSLSLPADVPSSVVLSNIHYTLDNTEPTADSPTYTEELNISKTTVVRAKLIHPNYLTNIATVHTYIISAKNLPLPVISISTDPSYLWDEEFGIYVKGNGKYGVTGKGMDYPVNWNNDWRRPSYFEYFPTGSNSAVLNQLCEIRIAGGWTRANPQKSLIVYANKRFGINRFYFDLFETKPNQEIKSFMIRNSGNDFGSTHFRDAAIQLFLGGKVDLDYQAYQPAIFYLNGDYWGIQNLRERSTEDFVLANYGTEDIDMIENWWDLKAGDRTAFDQLMNELRKSSSQRDIQWIMNQVDIDEYINYMILQIYVSNTDFPGNNLVLWRHRKTDGKWRFIVKDTDFGLGTNKVTHNAMRYNTENNNDDRKLFNALLTHDDFRKKFYRRFAVYMGDLLRYNSTLHVIDSIQKLIEPAMQDHLTRWMAWRDMSSWRNEISKMKLWCYERNTEMYKHLRDYFQLGLVMKLTYEKASNISESPAVFINDVRIRNTGLDASYFQKDMIDLRYEGNPLYSWEITKVVYGKTNVEIYTQQKLTYQIDDACTSLKIKLVNRIITHLPITDIQPEFHVTVGGNHLFISDLQPPSDIYIYDMSGRLIYTTSTTGSSINIPFNHQGVFIVNIRNNTQTFTQKFVNM